MRRILFLAAITLASPAYASFAERYPERAAELCEADAASARWIATLRQQGSPISEPMRVALFVKEPTARKRVIAIVREAYAGLDEYYPEPNNPRERRSIEESKRLHVRLFAEGVANECWRRMTREGS